MKNRTESKIKSLDETKSLRNLWKDQGLKVVFTNGCFDLIHLGHVDYLERARSLGDRLILGLNSDNSVRRIKGDNRPVMNEISRSRIMASLEFVNVVVLFEEDTPFNLIKELKPDILVKGSDYLSENIVGAEIVKEEGGEIRTIDLIEGYSTSSIISKIVSKNKE